MFFYFFRCPDKSKVQLALDEAVREHMAQDTLLRESLAACPREKLFWIWIVGDDCFRYFLTLTSHQDADPNSTSQSSLILHDSTMFCSFFGLSSGHQWSPTAQAEQVEALHLEPPVAEAATEATVEATAEASSRPGTGTAGRVRMGGINGRGTWEQTFEQTEYHWIKLSNMRSAKCITRGLIMSQGHGEQ